jgi:FAD/FMN-containing dehydrogenase
MGNVGAVAAPRNVLEASKILKICSDSYVPVIPYGGGTGLVGGQVGENLQAPLILSAERLTSIKDIFPEENVIVCEAGCTLEDIHEQAKKINRLFPLSLASKGSAKIGGNLATNAGGIGVLRYGNARDLCLGIEVAFPNGEMWSDLRRLRKDNSGYDVKSLLIGSEGTLGFVTAASLRLAPVPKSQATALLFVNSPKDALHILNIAQDFAAEGLSAFELLSGQGFSFIQETMPNVQLPFSKIPDWAILIHLGFGSARNAENSMIELYEKICSVKLASDGVLAKSQKESEALWELREKIPEANRKIGAIASHDISLPLSNISTFIDRAQSELSNIGQFRINCFGHLGDGNLHFNVFPEAGKTKDQYASQRDVIESLVHDLTRGLEGSFSAEHGIGRSKVKDLIKYSSPVKLDLIRKLKDLFDPNGIMNPGVIVK